MEEATKETCGSGAPSATTIYSGQIIAPEAMAGGRATCSRLAATSRTLSQPRHAGAAGLGVTGGATQHPGQLSQQGQGWHLPFVPLGCVMAVSGGTHSVPPLLSDAELFWRRNAFALLNAAGWVCSRVAFRGWKSDTGPGCKVKGKGQREVFPPHPPSAAGVSYPDVNAGAEHPVVALSPGTGGQGHAGGYLDAHPEVKQLFGPPEISGVSIPSQTCGNTFKKL